MEMQYDDGIRVGFIASISRPFCRMCNRIRLTCDGKLRNCLFALDEVDIKPLLRGPKDDVRLAQTIRENVLAKWEGHEINTARFVKPGRTMHAIGG
jgi:cyclic pyranopterin phosphate synthase